MAGIDIREGFKSAIDGVNGTVILSVLLAIGLIVVGSIMQAVTGGSITLPTAFNTVLNTLSTTVSGWFTTLGTTGTTIVALVVVAVLIALFAIKMFKSKKGDGY